ncbi:MAG: bacillithiol system redox-active protein YtxJ [Saprospiraceae bacterium]|jgi:bacillithiol system protein YtxJ|nr:bacillithiol system redox-active protein YtxJ [Saprospiraceae bacterium]
MVWKTLDSLQGLDTLLHESMSKNIVIFKHSTTCSISHMAKMRLEENWDLDDLDIYYLDLKKYRNVSDAIAEKLSVHHESPQILLIRNKECIYDASHFDISVNELKESLLWGTTPSL